MTLVWTNSTSVRHPWFLKSMKRKHSSSQTLEATEPTDGPMKRRKVALLEHGFSHLSLQPPPTSSGPDYSLPNVTEITLPQASFSSMDTDMDLSMSMPPEVTLPDSIEEPASSTDPDVPEVKMKRSTWYEPEKDRIVVTDLEPSSDEEDPDNESVSVAQPVLDRLKARVYESSIPLRQQSQALVLFRPLVIPKVDDRDCQGQGDGTDAMDVE